MVGDASEGGMPLAFIHDVSSYHKRRAEVSGNPGSGAGSSGENRGGV